MRTLAACLVAALAVTAAAAEARSPAVLVTYEQSGGFAGIERSLTVHRSGKVVADGFALRTRHLTPARLRTLRDALVKARFATLRRAYETDPPLADGFVYGVTYGARTVQVEEEAKVPARLERVLDLLSALVRT